MPSVYCTQCGHANPDDARFCSNCGTPLARAGQPPLPPPPPPRESPGESTSTISIGGFEALEAATEQAEAEPAGADQFAVEALPPGTALLVVKRGPNAGSRFLLDKDRTSAGRHPGSDIFLDDVTVSRRHAEFTRQGGSFAVRDVGSLNGTYVNRQRIDQAGLAGGDEVQIGKFRLVFLSNAQHG
ncbi:MULTISPECIES: FHA domain-containing protein [Actinomadura]|uniref:Glycogen accumulation regulator GarA n=2 Tax=Actinomadura TaxID=1988 RepID=A0A2P4UBP7_9ACTN|nr:MULTISPECIES: FHA domain-containing protein [Actinomadura]MXQ67139.1 FHA domain-containing protein [Actinomadura rayongensis]POM22471.1 Glycogen accumulation regulator GarA [Actinomadura rubteroloni]